MMKPHEKLRKLREKTALTQKDTAQKMAITEAYYNSLENGRRPISIKMAARLSTIFGISAGDILGYGTDNQPSARMLPVLGTTQAGDWKIIVNSWDGEKLPAVNLIGHPNAFYVRVEGNSMSPQIEHGDCVVVDPDQPIGNNQVGIFVMGDETTIKRLQKDAGKCYLVPDNNRFDPIKADEDVHQIGRVISVIRSQIVK